MNTASIAVVTSVWGTYDKYLPQWAKSIAAQTTPPTQVVIVDAGCRNPNNIQTAEHILAQADIPTTIDTITYTTLGDARNHAVNLTNTTWCLHLDADDTLLPHAITDIHQHTNNADVISLGAIQNGKPRVYPNITATKILARKHGIFSCGAFRKTYWAQRPWHTHNNWVDSTYWVGLAHLGARFASTGRVGFNYNQHPDSISRSLTPTQKAAAIKQWKQACQEWTLN